MENNAQYGNNAGNMNNLQHPPFQRRRAYTPQPKYHPHAYPEVLSPGSKNPATVGHPHHHASSFPQKPVVASPEGLVTSPYHKTTASNAPHHRNTHSHSKSQPPHFHHHPSPRLIPVYHHPSSSPPEQQLTSFQNHKPLRVQKPPGGPGAARKYYPPPTNANTRALHHRYSPYRRRPSHRRYHDDRDEQHHPHPHTPEHHHHQHHHNHAKDDELGFHDHDPDLDDDVEWVESQTNLLSITQIESQANTIVQESSSEAEQHTQPYSPDELPYYHFRLQLHPEVECRLSSLEKRRLVERGMYRIDFHESRTSVKLERDVYVQAFEGQINGVHLNKLSRVHCQVDYDPAKHTFVVTDKSTNGTMINGNNIGKNQTQEIQHGDVLALLLDLSQQPSQLALAYLIEDVAFEKSNDVSPRTTTLPSSISTTNTNTTSIPSMNSSAIPSLSIQDHLVQQQSLLGSSYASAATLPMEDTTIGILFSAPIAGKDTKGNVITMDMLNLQGEYEILTKSLIEATAMGTAEVVVEHDASHPHHHPHHAPYRPQDRNQTKIKIPKRINVSVRFATTDSFRNMVTMGCRALHFSGHGNENVLYFEDGRAGVHPVPHANIKDLFRAGQGSGGSDVRLVFVSACSSEAVASAFVSAGVAHVVAVKVMTKIEDQAAIDFTKSFYLALARGKSVRASFIIGTEQVANSPLIKSAINAAAKFRLLPEDAEHDEILFPMDTIRREEIPTYTATPRRFPSLCPNSIPSVCQGFCERQLDLYRLCSRMMHRPTDDSRLCTITGQEGVGKTNVAFAAARYIAERSVFEGGVAIFDIPRLADELELYATSTTTTTSSPSTPVTSDKLVEKLDVKLRSYLQQLAPNREYDENHPVSSLMVLDGCDTVLRPESRAHRFRQMISDYLRQNVKLKILITSRHPITRDGGTVRGYSERQIELRPFGPKIAAQLLLSISPRPIFFKEMKKVPDVEKLEFVDCVARHPALVATDGNPKRIAELASKLNDHQLDDIV